MKWFRRQTETGNSRRGAPARLWSRLAGVAKSAAAVEADAVVAAGEDVEPAVLWPRVAQALVATVALGLAVGVASSYHVWSTRTRQFKVQTFDIAGNARTESAEIIRASGLREGSPLIGEDARAVAQRIETLPWVADAQVSVHLPATLRIRLREHRPAALLVDGDLWVLDAEARVIKTFAPGDARDVPLLSGIAAADLTANVEAMPARTRGEERLRAEVETRRILARARAQALLRLHERVGDSALGECIAVGELHWDSVTGASLIAASSGAEIRVGHVTDDDLDVVLERAARLCKHAKARGERIRYALFDDRTHPERAVVATEKVGDLAAATVDP